ncbi:ModE family transcriptional regulator [Candidatus Marinarcus aquaticus]|uniref:ModE family transcriptional regulator n=1 Tax=Candidatus Marinarcus aquaticus TaxID=2044504 RepID=A0A4Q0XWX8_9BACT|nr:ModE family transcriptional regulator [Candidatus Marinarcus aquaticus]RXJ60789.1 ModE family transcriptional regulator [Candidatus Marinarcus aquaticus]
MSKTFQLDETQKDLILTNLDSDGELSCLKAFKVARLIGVKPIDMADVCESINIKITNCELGVFGKLDFHDASLQTYQNLAQNYTQDKRMECRIIWDEAQKSTLKNVGSTVKHSDIEVTNCQLGCFRERKGKKELND